MNYLDTFTGPNGSLVGHVADEGFGTWAAEQGGADLQLASDRVAIAVVPHTLGADDHASAVIDLSGLNWDFSVDVCWATLGTLGNSQLSLALWRASPLGITPFLVIANAWNADPTKYTLLFGADYEGSVDIDAADFVGTSYRWGVSYDLGTATYTLYREPVGGGTKTIIATAVSDTTPMVVGWLYAGLAGADAGYSGGWFDNLTLVTGTPSTIVADPDTIQAGAAQSTITVTAKDSGNNPIVGAVVVLSATGTGNTITQPTAPTDANGQAMGYVSATKAEVKTISATVDGNDLGVTTDLTVTAGPPSDLSYLDPLSLTTTVDEPATIVHIILRDPYGNPVPGVVPTVTVPGGPTWGPDGPGTVTTPGATGPDGGTTTTYTPPTTPGGGPGTITPPGGPPLTLPITVTAGLYAHFQIIVPADVLLNAATPVICEALDNYGNPTGFTGQLVLTGIDGAALQSQSGGSGPWRPAPDGEWGARVGATVETPTFVAGVCRLNVVLVACGSASRLAGQELHGTRSGVSNPFAATGATSWQGPV